MQARRTIAREHRAALWCGPVVLALAVFSVVAPGLAQATDYYACDCQGDADGDCVPGNDANTGLSPAQAWQTWNHTRVAAADNKAACGDRFLFCKGGHWEHAASGQTIQWYDRDTKLDCRTPEQGGGSANVEMSSYVPPWASGDEARPKIEETSGSSDLLSFGLAYDMKGFLIDGLHLYCNPNIGGENGIYIVTGDSDSGWITIQNSIIEGFAQAMYTKAGWGGVPQHVVLRNSSVINNVHQGIMGSENRSLLIENNYFENNGCGPGRDPDTCLLDHQIYVNDSIGLTIRGNEFTRNSVDDNGDCRSVAVMRNSGSNVIVEDNWIHEPPDGAGTGCWGFGGTLGTGVGGCTNCIFRRNRVTNYKDGFHFSATDGAIFENNVIEYESGYDGNACNAMSFPSSSPVSNDMTIRNNTILINGSTNCTARGIYRRVDQGNSHSVYNNVVVINDGDSDGECFHYSNAVSPGFEEIDNNLCFFESGSSGSYAYDAAGGTRYTTIADWRSGTPWGDDSMEADPDLDASGRVTSSSSSVVNAGKASTTTTAMSPTCDATPGFWVGSCGAPPARVDLPDIGAFEFGGTGATPPPRPASPFFWE
jgi:hypothetical protein